MGSASSAGGAIKEAGTAHWQNPNDGATNSSGFTDLPGGYYAPDSYPTNYYEMGAIGNFWTSTQSKYEEEEGVYKQLLYNSTQVWKMTDLKTMGFSVRCVKD